MPGKPEIGALSNTNAMNFTWELKEQSALNNTALLSDSLSLSR